jgi:hypothetical protein
MTEDRSKLIKRLSSTTVAGAVIFVLTLSIFLFSRVHQVTDSSYSMLLSQSLLKHHSFTLDEYALPHHKPVWHGYYFKNGPLYQLEVTRGHLYYHLPPGTSILSAPFVAVLNLFGISAANADGTYNGRGEMIIEAGLAALLMALLSAIVFYTAQLLLPVKWSVVIAIGSAFGTQVYSTASRALWSETWGILLLGIAIFLLLRSETGKRTFNPILMASLLSWMYFVRPTFSVHILAITVYLLIYHRRLFLPFALTGAAWLSVFIFYSWFHFGQLLPNYYLASRLQFDTFWIALAGNLISPARGLLIYVPSLFFVAYLLVRFRRHVIHTRLVWLSLSIIISHLLIVSSFPHWWGGHSFGPRFMTGVVPWLVLLSILGIKAMLNWRLEQAKGHRPASLKAQLTVGAVLLLFSMFIHTRGAASHATWLWNMRPISIDESPSRLWDWREPQFLAGWVSSLVQPAMSSPLPPPMPREFAPISGRIDFTTADADKYLWYGWSNMEERFRWTDGKEAAIVFSLNQVTNVLLEIKPAPFLTQSGKSEQRVYLKLND